MKFFVCVKQVPDTEAKIKVASDKSGIETSGFKWVLNPYDEIAVEEAIKTKEANAGSTVTVVSVGPKKRVVDCLRTGLAMGADDAIVIDAPEDIDNYLTAKALAKVIKDEGPADLVFAGKLAIDDNASSVTQQVAEFLDIPHVTVVSKIEAGSGEITVEREVEGGTKEILQLKKPAIIGANKGLNTPRYASLPGIMKAKKKPLKEIEFTSLGFSIDQRKTKFVDFQMPDNRAETKILEGEIEDQVKELVRLLREEAKVL